MQIQINQKDLAKINKTLSNLKNLNESELLEAVARPIENSIRDSFESETDPWGVPWVNQNSKTYNHLDSSSHNMQGSLHSKVSSKKAIVGVNATSEKGYNYPAVHQFGSKKTSGRGSNIPSRKFMPYDENENLAPGVEEDILESAIDFLEELTK